MLQTRRLWVVSRPTITRVTSDLPECKQPLKKKNASKKKNGKHENCGEKKGEKKKPQIFVKKTQIVKKKALKGYVPRRLEIFFEKKKVTTNRAAIEVGNEKNQRKNPNLDRVVVNGR